VRDSLIVLPDTDLYIDLNYQELDKSICWDAVNDFKKTLPMLIPPGKVPVLLQSGSSNPNDTNSGEQQGVKENEELEGQKLSPTIVPATVDSAATPLKNVNLELVRDHRSGKNDRRDTTKNRSKKNRRSRSLASRSASYYQVEDHIDTLAPRPNSNGFEVVDPFIEPTSPASAVPRTFLLNTQQQFSTSQHDKKRPLPGNQGLFPTNEKTSNYQPTKLSPEKGSEMDSPLTPDKLNQTLVTIRSSLLSTPTRLIDKSDPILRQLLRENTLESLNSVCDLAKLLSGTSQNSLVNISVVSNENLKPTLDGKAIDIEQKESVDKSADVLVPAGKFSKI
jgi:hypothetical protein